MLRFSRTSDRPDGALHADACASTTWTRNTAAVRSSTWTRRATTAVAGVLAGLVAVAPGVATAATVPPTGPVHQYVVRAVPGQLGALHADLQRRGTVVRQIRLINADVVRLPASEATRLAADRRVAQVSQDVAVRLHGSTETDSASESLAEVSRAIGATALRHRGITGAGVDVALIDSGTAAVDGLARNKVIHGPDLSLDSQDAATRYLDGYGHGTHMAGIIAGRDSATGFTGIAPGARILSVKVADKRGNADVSQVIAGIDWVVQHAQTGDLNVRVLNLSFGTDSKQAYTIDPLAYAAEQAWHAGIVVVVSAGNAGIAAGGLTDPAIDPYVLAVAAADTTDDTTVVAPFSSRGRKGRNPDLAAPGVGIVSLRAPGSTLDTERSSARVGTLRFRGSGTSQAAAAVSGAAALLLQARPELTPDQVKAALNDTAVPFNRGLVRAQGNGLVDVDAAASAGASGTRQGFTRSNGTGTLEGSRGSAHLGEGEDALRGETDIMGRAVDTTALARLTASRAAWDGGSFNGAPWTGEGFSSTTWASTTWASTTWASTTWASTTWASSSWASTTWAANTWAASTWASTTWASTTWASSTWASSTWG